MSVPSQFSVMRDGQVLRMNPGSTRLDKEAFSAELAAATEYARKEGVPVLWNHNGVECSTEELSHHPDTWGWVSETSGQMAN